MTTRNYRSGTPRTPVVSNDLKTYTDGRGASTVMRAKPVGADPLAVGEGKNDTAAQLEHLAAKRRG